MQEEIEHKTVNFAISTTKLSARTLLRGMQFLLRQYDKHASQGKQSMKRLVRQNRGVTNVEIQKTGIKDFDRFAKRYHIDYSIQKDLSCTPPRYMVYFKAQDTDALNAAFKEYSASVLDKTKRPSVLAKLHDLAQSVANLTEDEYAAARASTLNAHYTSPVVIRAIYDAVEKMGFQSGNILEPSMGVGNFFGMLPDSMTSSRLYGVELDSITGRIAQKLYPQANITVAGFETTDRRDFYDLAVGNVPFGQYKVSDKAYNKLGFSSSHLAIRARNATKREIGKSLLPRRYSGLLTYPDGGFAIGIHSEIPTRRHLLRPT